MRAWTLLGQALFDRSREGIVQPATQQSQRRNAIALARSAAFDWTVPESAEAATRH
jgi:hypothetical protein